jgi:hypothetical protein
VPRYAYFSPVFLSSTATEKSGAEAATFASAALSFLTCPARLVFASCSGLGPVGDGLADADADGEADWVSLTHIGVGAVDTASPAPWPQPPTTTPTASTRMTKRDRCTRAWCPPGGKLSIQQRHIRRYRPQPGAAHPATVTYRFAAPSAVTDAFHLANAGGTNVSGNVDLPTSGGWGTWTTATATITLPAGVETLTLAQDHGGWDLNYLTFS